MTNRLKETTIHTIIKALSPKREANGPKKGRRAISRSISPEPLSYLTSYLNNHVEAVVEACEQSLNGYSLSAQKEVCRKRIQENEIEEDLCKRW